MTGKIAIALIGFLPFSLCHAAGKKAPDSLTASKLLSRANTIPGAEAVDSVNSFDRTPASIDLKSDKSPHQDSMSLMIEVQQELIEGLKKAK